MISMLYKNIPWLDIAIMKICFNQNGSLLSQRNNLLEETMVIAEQRSPTLSGNITNIQSELRSPRLSRDVTIHTELQSPRLTRESIHSEHLNNSSLHFVKTVPEEDEEEAAEEVSIQLPNYLRFIARSKNEDL